MKINGCVSETSTMRLFQKEQFDMVQEIMKKDTRTSPQNDTVYALSGYVKCGDCGQNMVRRTASKKGKKYFYYHCSTYKNGGDCTSHNISCQKVDEAVLDAMQKQIAVLDKIDTILETLDQYPGQQIGVKTLEKQLEKMKNDMEYYGMLKAKLYRDMVDGIVSKQDYIDLNASFEASRKDIEDNYHRVEYKRSEMLAGKIRFQPWIRNLREYASLTLSWENYLIVRRVCPLLWYITDIGTTMNINLDFKTRKR